MLTIEQYYYRPQTQRFSPELRDTSDKSPSLAACCNDSITSCSITNNKILIPRLHDEANIMQSSSKHRRNVKQTSSKFQALRAHVMHVYYEYICLMVA